MHEFSLAGEVLKLAESEARKNIALSVSEINIEVGTLSGVDAGAFESAMRIVSENSVLENSVIKIIRINAKGICSICNKEYEMNRRIDTCPECHSFPCEVKGGYEFRVVSILIEQD